MLSFLTLFVLFTSGPDVLVLLSLLVLAVLGMGVFGALGEARRPGGTCEASGAVRRRRRAGAGRRGRGLLVGGPRTRARASAGARPGAAGVGARHRDAPAPLSVRLADPHDAVRPRFKRPPRAGLLFDVDTGQCCGGAARRGSCRSRR